MSRIKILLLVLIIALLSIVFVQNQQPIALKLLCADSSQTCLYQTPALPLAVWIALFVLTGAIANLLIQALDRFGNGNSHRKAPILDDELYANDTTRRPKSDRSTKYSHAADPDSSVRNDVSSYEVKQEPQNVEKSGSTYSYKYREAGNKLGDRDNNGKGAVEDQRNPNPDSNEEDWI